MIDYKIEIGESEERRYVGIQHASGTPLEDADLDILAESLDPSVLRDAFASGGAFVTVAPSEDNAYSEIRFNPVKYNDPRILKVADDIGGILAAGGKSVVLNTEIKPVSKGNYLFGGQVTA